MHDVWDYGEHPCDKGVFVPQDQIEDQFHEWDIGETHLPYVLGPQDNRDIIYI